MKNSNTKATKATKEQNTPAIPSPEETKKALDVHKDMLFSIFAPQEETSDDEPKNEPVSDKKEILKLKKESQDVTNNNPNMDEKEEDQTKAKDTKDISKKEITEDEDNNDLSIKLKTAEKIAKDSKDWGHKKNIQLVNLKKNILKEIDNLVSTGNVFEEDKEAIIASIFNNIDIENNSNNVPEQNTTDSFFDKLNNEFKLFKKYNKQEDADDKYNAFFSFLNLHTPTQRDEIVNYMMNADNTNEVIDYIMHEGERINKTLFQGIKKYGGIVEYVSKLQEKIEKITEENKKFKNELDSTVKKVYPKQVNQSRVFNNYSPHNNDSNWIKKTFGFD